MHNVILRGSSLDELLGLESSTICGDRHWRDTTEYRVSENGREYIPTHYNQTIYIEI